MIFFDIERLIRNSLNMCADLIFMKSGKDITQSWDLCNTNICNGKFSIIIENIQRI